LIEKGANVNQKTFYGRSSLIPASNNGHIEICEFLIEKGISINEHSHSYSFFSESALYISCKKGRLEICKLLVKKGANVNCTNYFNRTPLHIASKKGRFEICKFLIENGADVNLRDKKSETPIQYASQNEYREISNFLKRHKYKNIVTILLGHYLDPGSFFYKEEFPLDVLKIILFHVGYITQTVFSSDCLTKKKRKVEK